MSTNDTVHRLDDDACTKIVSAAQNGDRVARAAICEQFTPLVHASAMRYRGIRLQWDDLVQTGFEHLLLAVDSFSPQRGVYFAHYAKIKVRGGIYSHVRRSERNHARERYEDRDAPDSWMESKLTQTDRFAVPTLIDHTASSDLSLSEWHDLFACLSPRERLAMQATVLAGYTTGDLALREGVSVETAKTWRKRGLHKLRKQLESRIESRMKSRYVGR